MPQPTHLSYLGLAREVTRGVPAAATDFLPVQTMTPHDDLKYFPDQGMRGSMVTQYDNIAGARFATYSLGGDVYPDIFGFLLAAMLGDVTTTGAAAPFTHAMSVLNAGDGQPPSLTLTDYDGVNARQFPGMIPSDLSVKFTADGLLSYTAALTGFGSSLAAAPVRSFSAVPPIANWRGTATVGGAADVTVIDGGCDIKRAIDVIQNVDGSQQPYRIWGGPVTVSGTLTVVSESVAGTPDSHLGQFLAGTATTLVLDWLNAGTELRLAMSKTTYTVANVQRGKAYVEVALTYEANANAIDIGGSGGYSPIKGIIQSAKAAGSYR